MTNDNYNAEGYFVGYRDHVREEWIDYNDHMNVAYYVLAFDLGSDKFLAHLAMDEEYVQKRSKSVFVVDMNVTYKQELSLNAPIYVATQLLGFTEKKMHLYHHMYHAEDGFLAATNEIFAVHVDMVKRGSCPFPDDIYKNLVDVMSKQKKLPTPKNVGRVISLQEIR